MNRYFLLLIFTLSSFGKTFIISDQIPKMTSLLMEEYGYDLKGTKEERQVIINKFLNRFKVILPEYEDEITLYVLNKSLSLNKGLKTVSHKVIKDFDEAINNKIKEERVFSIYISNRLKQDLGEVITSSGYSKYQRFLTKKIATKDSEIRNIERSLRIITPWIDFVLSNSSEEVDTFFKNNITQLLIHLKSYTRFINFYAPINKPKEDKDFVTLYDQGLHKAREEIQKITFDLFPEKDSNYIAPEKLPESVDDWVPVDDTVVDDNNLPLTKDELFPDPSELYYPPKTLPRSSDEDWN